MPAYHFNLLEEIARNDIHFAHPEQLKWKVLAHLKSQLLQNKISKEEFETYKRELLKELKHLKIANDKREIIKKQVNAAFDAAAILEGFENSLRRSIELNHWLKRLRKILLQRMKLLRLKRQKTSEEFGLMMLEMERLQLESELESEKEKREREQERRYFEIRIQEPIEIANNLTDIVVGSYEVLSELLELDKKPILQKAEQETLKDDFLYLESTLRSEKIEDKTLEEIDTRLSSVCTVLGKIYDSSREMIAEDDLEKNKILNNWCDRIEVTLLDWINNEYVEKFDHTMREKIVRDLTQDIHLERSKEQAYVKAFTPMKKVQSMLHEKFNRESHPDCKLKTFTP